MLFPPRCAVCDCVIGADECHICRECAGKLSFVTEPRCMKCGKEIEDEDEEYCMDCMKRERSFVKGFPLFNYKPPVSEAVSRIKYGGREEYVGFYADELYKCFGDTFLSLGLSGIIPVPIHEKRMKKRGYNQAELLARELSKRTGIPVIKDIVVRVIDTKPQKELNDVERMQNLQDAFQVTRKVHGCFLIADDIYTTGSTIETITKKLHAAGAGDIYYTSICIGRQ